jgi:DNA-directed RNA polymerase specialized sigma24 family protein
MSLRELAEETLRGVWRCVKRVQREGNRENRANRKKRATQRKKDDRPQLGAEDFHPRKLPDFRNVAEERTVADLTAQKGFEIILEAIRPLPPKVRDLLVVAYGLERHGLRVRDLARIRRMTPGAHKVALSRARSGPFMDSLGRKVRVIMASTPHPDPFLKALLEVAEGRKGMRGMLDALQEDGELKEIVRSGRVKRTKPSK